MEVHTRRMPGVYLASPELENFAKRIKGWVEHKVRASRWVLLKISIRYLVVKWFAILRRRWWKISWYTRRKTVGSIGGMKRDIRFLPILLISSRGASTLHKHKIFGTQHLGFFCDQSSRDTRKKTNSGLCLLAKPRYQISSDSFDFLEIEKYYIPEASEPFHLVSGLNLVRLKITQYSTRSQSQDSDIQTTTLHFIARHWRIYVTFSCHFAKLSAAWPFWYACLNKSQYHASCLAEQHNLYMHDTS